MHELDKGNKRELEKLLQSKPLKRKPENKARGQVTEYLIWIYPFHF